MTGAELAAIQAKGAMRVGAFSLVRRPAGLLESTQDTVSGQFSRLDALSFLRSQGIFGLPALGSCVQNQINRTELAPSDPVQGMALNAGAALSLVGPNGSRAIDRGAAGAYSAVLGGAAESGGSQPAFLEPGSYTLSGGGGADVGAFEARFAFPAAPVWTNRNPSALARTFSPSFQWTLTGQADYVIVALYGRNDSTAFYTICTEDPAKRTFTIPRYNYAGTVQHTSAAPGVVWIGTGRLSRFDAPGLDLGFVSAVAGTAGVYIP